MNGKIILDKESGAPVLSGGIIKVYPLEFPLEERVGELFQISVIEISEFYPRFTAVLGPLEVRTAKGFPACITQDRFQELLVECGGEEFLRSLGKRLIDEANGTQAVLEEGNPENLRSDVCADTAPAEAT